MRHPIDPTVDCVFKALLGAEENRNLLCHFLNAVLRPRHPVRDVELLNPHNERDASDAKLTVVDVKARDARGRTYQVEVQLATRPWLATRILYTWSAIYHEQLKAGEAFGELGPVVSVWLLVDGRLTRDRHHRHHFVLHDPEHHVTLSDHLNVLLLELTKWSPSPSRPGRHQDLDHEATWLYFFKEAASWTALPSRLDTPEMRQAMSVLERFSEKEAAYHAYEARMNYLREQRSVQLFLEQAAKEKEEAAKAKQQALEREQQLLEENKRLLQRLRDAGLEPQGG